MKNNISRGQGFRGLLNYVLDEGAKATGEKKPEIVGGNMVGSDAKSLANEFSASRKLRPDIKRPVWHCSLTLPENEKLDSEKWKNIGEDFLKKMKLDPKKHQYILVRHNDTDKDHVHIVATRISLDSEVWLGKFELYNAIEATQQLEKEYGLTLTPDLWELDENGNRVKRSNDKKSLTFNEIQQAARKGEAPARAALQNILDESLNEEQSIFAFIEKVEAAGAIALPNVAKTGKMNGFSFNYSGISFKGSDLGKGYSWKNLKEKGVNYEQDRDSKELIGAAKRIKQEISAISNRESAPATDRAAQSTTGIEQNIGSDGPVERAKHADRKTIDDQNNDINRDSGITANDINKPRSIKANDINKQGESSHKRTANSNKGSNETGGRIEQISEKNNAENMVNNGVVGSNGWSNIGDRVSDLAASTYKNGVGDGSGAKITDAWKQQHNALSSPAYRLTLIPRGDGKPYNMGKKSDGTEQFFTAQEVENKIPLLRRKNAQGRDIYITPIDSKHHYIVVDDLTPDTMKSLEIKGYQPCLIQESSKDNLQAILKIEKLDRPDEQQLANKIVKGINKLYGDPKFSGVIHPFRMAGFSNKKPSKNNVITKIIHVADILCKRATRILCSYRDMANERIEKDKITRETNIKNKEQQRRLSVINSSTINISDSKGSDYNAFFTREWNKKHGLAKSKGWEIDYSRIDFSVVKTMLKSGWSKEDTEKALSESSPEIITRKNNPTDYIDRTVSNALVDQGSSEQPVNKKGLNPKPKNNGFGM
jgi:hypothetical protein